LPANLQKPINVVDFATPVQRIDAKPYGGGSQVVLTSGRVRIAGLPDRQRVRGRDRTQGGGSGGRRGHVGHAGVGRQDGGCEEVQRPPVTFNFQDVPVRTVLQLIAEESNLNIVASDTVQGNVTLRLVNVPWDQAWTSCCVPRAGQAP
jgi:type IV pilus assembly protein PilQ